MRDHPLGAVQDKICIVIPRILVPTAEVQKPVDDIGGVHGNDRALQGLKGRFPAVYDPVQFHSHCIGSR